MFCMSIAGSALRKCGTLALKINIYLDPMNEEVSTPEQSDIAFISSQYQVLTKAGEGTFSVVYKAVAVGSEDENKHVAIKAVTKTSSPARIAEELGFLKRLNGAQNVIQLLASHRLEDQVCMVFPYFETTDFRTLLRDCTVRDIKFYMYNLLVAVGNVHTHKIIHRDIKPSNFLYNREKKCGILIDFGLAQHEKDEKKGDAPVEETSRGGKPSLLFFNSMLSKITQPPGYYVGDTRPQMRAQRAGTRGFRAPEVLFRSPRQSRSIDMWSAGVVFLILCTKQYPFFNAVDDTDAIVEIATIFGHAEMRAAAKNCERIWRSNLATIPAERIPFEKLVESLNPGCSLPSEGYDLIYRMLDLVPDHRISAADALGHPFFNDVK